MFQFSDKHKIKISFHINEHPIKYFLSHFKDESSLHNSISKNISFLKIKNYVYKKNNNIISYQYKDVDKIIINYLNSLYIHNGNVYIYLINHPDENQIKTQHKEKII